MTPSDQNAKNKSTMWKKYLIIAVAATSIGIFIAIILAVNHNKPNEQVTPPPIKETLKLISINPKPLEFESVWSTEKITLTFNKPIDQKTIYHQISPQEDLKIIFSDASPASVSFVPLTGWEENVQYALSISKQLSSTSGEQLEKNLEIKFTRKAPENLPEPIENY